ncbi:MAG: hypothetical protein RQ875_14405, partial [Vicingaceae bacterium]|nr:hypothetical protein [Vicingaceae bacterium]
MKKLLAAIAICSIAFSSLMAQNAIWSLPPNFYKVGFPVQPLPTNTNSYAFFTDYGGWQSEFTHAAYPDINGEPLFFIVD